jgi:hypothetical protein
MKPSDQEMTEIKSPLRSPLLKDDIDSPSPAQPVAASTELLIEDDYYETNTEPIVPFKHLPLAIIPGLLVSGNIQLANIFAIPSLQYLFVTVLFSFLINYYLIRKHSLYPYLKIDKYDKLVKLMCVVAFFSFLSTIYWGWNGSASIIISIIW